MGFIEGQGRNQGTLFPVALDDLVPADHVCRVIDAFVDGLKMVDLRFERAEAAQTGRPGYDPRDLLKLYLYGYLNQIRSSRRLEAECRRNVELMWLLGRLYPDHKSIAEFRRMHRDAVVAAGAELVRFARGCGLIRGEWIAIDGSKFRAVASIDSTRERLTLQRYLDSIEKADEEQQASIDPSVPSMLTMPLSRVIFDKAISVSASSVCPFNAMVVYARGWYAIRLTRETYFTVWRLAAFLLGIVMLWLAIGSPLDAFADVLLSAHMVQHLLLMSVVPPLVLLGAPVVPLLRGLPRWVVKTVLRP
jgi:transposase